MKIYFIVAHPDDEAYGPFGTITKAVKDGHDVSVLCLCNGARPTAPEVSKARAAAFIWNCETNGVKWRMWDNNDLTLDVKHVTEFLTSIVDVERPDIVFTHSISDLNRDHRVVAEAALVACRPKLGSSVRSLYFFEIPSSTDWTFGQIHPTFEPNTFIDITEEMAVKKAALARYDTETYQYPDARSVEAMVALACHRGYQTGIVHAEAFKLVFSRSHKIL